MLRFKHIIWIIHPLESLTESWVIPTVILTAKLMKLAKANETAQL